MDFWITTTEEGEEEEEGAYQKLRKGRKRQTKPD